MVDQVLLNPSSSLKGLGRRTLTVEAIHRQPGVCQGKNQLEDYQHLRVLGTGGFSSVVLSRDLRTGHLAALKLVELMGQQCPDMLAQEVEISNRAKSPFLQRLFWAGTSGEYLVMANEFYGGGELFRLLEERKAFPKDMATFYLLELVFALEALEKMQVVYRDLKMENIMLDGQGHLRLVDFGLSRQMAPGQTSQSFCGSLEYMPPEMLSASQHDRTVDFYSLGALFYEMLLGCPPFYHPDHDTMKHNIIHHQLHFPDYIDVSSRILLAALLHKDPPHRLGAKGGTQEILHHPFFHGIDLGAHRTRKVKVPFVPDPFGYYFPEEAKDSQQLLHKLNSLSSGGTTHHTSHNTNNSINPKQPHFELHANFLSDLLPESRPAPDKKRRLYHMQPCRPQKKAPRGLLHSQSKTKKGEGLTQLKNASDLLKHSEPNLKVGQTKSGGSQKRKPHQLSMLHSQVHIHGLPPQIKVSEYGTHSTKFTTIYKNSFDNIHLRSDLSSKPNPPSRVSPSKPLRPFSRPNK